MIAKRIISSVLFSVLLLVCMVLAIKEEGVASAADYVPVVTVEDKTVHRGQTFTIDVDLSGNGGLISLYLSLTYDKSIMQLTGVERGDALGSMTYTNTNADTDLGFAVIPFNMLWDGRTQDGTDGRLVRLTFESFSSAPVGVYPLTVTYNKQNTNSEYATPIDIEISGGFVTIVKGEFEAIWYDWNGVELYRKDYNAEDDPAYLGETPFREDNEFYSYDFVGWKGLPSEEPNVILYEADYLLTPQTYQVFFYADGMNESTFDGVVTTDDFYAALEIDYGSFLDFEYPLKARYAFSGWFTDPDCTKPFIDATMPAANLSLYGYFVYDIRTTSVPKIRLSTVMAEDERYMTVYANMVDNTGFNAMVLTLAYDRSAIELIGFTNTDTFSALQFDYTNTEYGYDVDDFKFYYEHSENTFETGVFLELRFKVRDDSESGVYDVTFTLGNTDATYINGVKGIRYTEIEIIGTRIPVGKINRWEKSAEDKAEIIVESEIGMPADTTLRVSFVPESKHNISPETIEKVAGENMETKAVYNLRLLRVMGDIETEIEPNGKLTITIKLTPEQQACERLALYYVSDDGQMTLHESRREGENLIFGTDHLSQWAIIGEKALVRGKLSDAAVMLISMPILLAIVTMGYVLILLGKYKKKKEKEEISA